MSNQTQEKTEPSQQPQQQNPPVLEEDDEFEDFPVEGEPALYYYTHHIPQLPQAS